MSQETKKYCEFPMCDRIEDRDGFCFLHAKHFAGPKPQAKMKAKPKQSENRKVTQKEYVKIVKEMLATDPYCEIREFGCTIEATGLHHKQKRSPSNFTKRENLMRACDSCNLWVENNPLEAIEKGYSISKHIKNTE